MARLEHSASALTLTAVALCVCLGAMGSVRAQEETSVTEAKERFEKGLMFVDEGDYRKAVIEFEESYRIYPTAVVLYNMARCYDELHRYSKAVNLYKKYVAEAKNLGKKTRVMLKKRISVLEKLLGVLTVNCNVVGAKVILDGEEIGTTPLKNFYSETGKHSLVVKKDKCQDFTTTFRIVSGRAITVKAVLKPVKEAEHQAAPGKGAGKKVAGPTARPVNVSGPERRGNITSITSVAEAPRRKLTPTAFYSLLGVTLALGVGTGVVAGLNSANHEEFLNTDYSDREKWQDLKDQGELYNNLFIGLAVGAGAAAVATVLTAIFTDFGSGPAEPAGPGVSFGVIPGDGGFQANVSIPLSW